ncbi:MAG: fumarylacetoacetate hydrolase family protein [Flavobacteriaceae bacterium]|jgi:2-keto-4-pentenoate hydratase/2-oxohepta-3-ene-1,7-dioic acid hydratase in catechol pathway
MKIICIGRNYKNHVNELNNIVPTEPVIFLKPDTSIILKKQPFFIPDFSNDIHHEVEVIVKINRVGKYISKEFAHKYYDKIGLGIDFTARDIQQNQKKFGLPWEKAKAFDGSALIGKWVNKTSFDDINDINFSLMKNNELVQQGNTSQMLWDIDSIIAYVSSFFTLKIGDIIFTGTPAGVGAVKENDKLKGFINGDEFFDLKIR